MWWNGLRQTRSLNIQVLAPLSLTISGPSQTYVGIQQTWRFSCPDAILPADLVISWGDGTVPGVRTMYTSYVDIPYTYGGAGNFIIAADVTDYQDGRVNNTGSDTHTVQVASVMSANLSVDDNTPAPGQQITFTINVSGGFPGYNWTLNYGDGSGSSSGSGATDPYVTTRSHTYMMGGQTYTVVLTVEDALGGATEMSLPIGVGAGNGLEPTNFLPLLAVAVLAVGILYVAWKR